MQLWPLAKGPVGLRYPPTQPVVDQKCTEREMACDDHVQTLLFPKQCGNYLHNLFVVLGFIDNLDVIYSV